MGWFDEQIRQRKLSDQEIMEDSLFRMAASSPRRPSTIS